MEEKPTSTESESIPTTESATQPEPELPLDPTIDRFPHGKVVRYQRDNRYGFIRDRTGKDIYFNLDEVRFVGEKDHHHLHEGLAVGYDVGWTAHGLHVTKLKIL